MSAPKRTLDANTLTAIKRQLGFLAGSEPAVAFGGWNADLHPHGEHGQWASTAAPEIGGVRADKPDGCQNDTVFPKSPAALTSVKLLGGSTGARLMKDETGRKYVVKRGANPGHIREEFAADSIYRALGLTVQDSKLFETPDGPVKVARYLDDVVPLGVALDRADGEKKASILSEIRRGFAVDALLGNWDVIGMESDNVMMTPKGEAVRIDNGGSLRYRAMGKLKSPGAWSPAATEIDSMRGVGPQRGASSAVAIFGGMSDQEIKGQVADLVKNRKAVIDTAPPELRDTLDARVRWLADKFGVSCPKGNDGKSADFAGEYRGRDLHATGEWPLPAVQPGRQVHPTYGGVVFNGEGKVLLREPANHYDGYHWTFAKGGPDKGEEPADTALREVREETGHEAKIVGHVPGVHVSRPGSGSAAYFYLMHSDHATDHTDEETSAVRWASPDEARKLLSLSENEGGRERDLRLLDAATRAHAALKANFTRGTAYWNTVVNFDATPVTRLDLYSRLDATPGMTATAALSIIDNTVPA
jgi:8-oxo-dGTP pyrophosphatase MutT (NUDIX family)